MIEFDFINGRLIQRRPQYTTNVFFGRNNTVVDSYLYTGGTIPSNLSGFTIPFGGIISNISCTFSAPSSCTVEFYLNGVLSHSTVIPGVTGLYESSIAIPVDAGDVLSVRLSGSGARPAIYVFFN